MTEKKIWLITGAGRGLGVDIAKAVLAAGHAVVATGRDAAKIMAAVGDHNNLLAFKLDVTHPQDAQAAVEAAVVKFGRIDVLVNNAGNFFAGFFEELSPEQVRNQIETLLFGPMNVTRAVLPVMRQQRSGLLLTISSTAGIAGQMFCTAYAAARGLEGWWNLSGVARWSPCCDSEPGFRTGSTRRLDGAEACLAAERQKVVLRSLDRARWRPVKLAAALVKLVPPKIRPPARCRRRRRAAHVEAKPTRFSPRPSPRELSAPPSRTRKGF